MNNRKQHPRKTVAYVRVSTEDQAKEGVSLEAQRARIAAYCTALEIEVSEYIEDAGISAKTLERPGASKILDGIRSGEIGSVVVIKLDRLTRRVRDLCDLLDLCAKNDVALVSVTEHLDTSTAAGRMMVNILGVVAQWERETIAERTVAALAHKRASGRVYSGSVPFGYRRDGNDLVPDATQQEALMYMQSLDDSGLSFRTIAEALEMRGYKTRNGGTKWHAASVRSVLRSKMVTAAP